MDAIRKKMQSLKSETDQLYATINKFENETKEANSLSDKYDCDIRDLGKKIQSYEVEFDETNDKLTKVSIIKFVNRALINPFLVIFIGLGQPRGEREGVQEC